MKRLLVSLSFVALIAVAVVSGCSSKNAAPQMSVPTATLVPTATPQVVAQVKIQSGTAQYRSGADGDFQTAPNNAGIAVGDSVRSGPNSQVAVGFSDGSVLVLLASSEVEIQSYFQSRTENKVTTRVTRVAVITGDVSGDIREDLIFPPSVFEIISAGEIYTIKGTLSE